MRKDEEGEEVPHTLGEYRTLCKAIGGSECSAVKWLDQQISENEAGEDEEVVVPDSQMRSVLMPMLMATTGDSVEIPGKKEQ